jgi:hypothetical protein
MLRHACLLSHENQCRGRLCSCCSKGLRFAAQGRKSFEAASFANGAFTRPIPEMQQLP